jgi:hypothetical protein
MSAARRNSLDGTEKVHLRRRCGPAVRVHAALIALADVVAMSAGLIAAPMLAMLRSG